jgi:hypothetical protein
VYGLPAYNWEQTEVSFNVNGANANCNTGLVPYTNTEASINNPRNPDRYYSRTEIPAYPYAHHLTAVLYPDYVDVTGDGISSDDLGNYVKFNYTQQRKDHEWRIPTQANMANYNPGLGSDPNDDKGSYIYGRKEIYNVHSVESRNFIAEFKYAVASNNNNVSLRYDANEVNGEHGGTNAADSARLFRLERIELYSKRERMKDGASAKPVKTVHFEHEYTLVNGTPSSVHSSTKKLTLKRLYFTYADSKKGKESPYVFNYSSNNPAYSLKGYDRWGSFKPQDCSGLSNADFPYTSQDTIPAGTSGFGTLYPGKRYADYYAEAWLLNSIRTPAGGEISVEYEADDYAYVQNRKAMEMFILRGFNTSNSLSGIDNKLYKKTGGGISPNYEARNWMFVNLRQKVADASAFYNQYLKGIDQLYFRTKVDVTNSGDYEYVTGYGEIDDYDLIINGNEYIGAIKLKSVGIKDNNQGDQVNPIPKAAWNFVRLNLPGRVYPGSDPNGEGESAIMSLIGFAMDIKGMVQGINKMLRSGDFGQEVDLARSWVRLQNPDGFKHGGGVPVKRIQIDDAWSAMTGGTTHSYGQTYDYRTTNAAGDTISSGVAAYEPILGGDENPFREPVFFKKENLLAPDDEHYVETPMGESFFPGPTVIYAKVAVQDIGNEDVKRRATGKVVHEFYTAKDFPTITQYTNLDAKHKKPNFILSFFNISTVEYMTTAQGYVVKLNDMHGKPKAQWVYAEEQDAPISGVEYFYRTKSQYDPGKVNELDNDNVRVINRNATISQATVGKDIEMVMDARQQSTETFGFTLGGNLDGFLAFIFPVAIPTVWPLPVYEHNRFRSLVATKVVNTYGILDKTVVHDLSARVSTRNTAYDAETGEVLLSETSNEFKDDIYNLSYPAHWAYEGMRPAYQNVGASWSDVALSTAVGSGLLSPGDELILVNGANTQRVWMLTSSTPVDRDGNVFPTSGNYEQIQVVRSGHRNQQAMAIGAVTAKADPLAGSWTGISNVVDASATEYKDDWNMYCNELGPCFEPCTCNANPQNASLVDLLNTLAQNRAFRRNIPPSSCLFSYDHFEQDSMFFVPVNSGNVLGYSSNIGRDWMAMGYDETNQLIYGFTGCANGNEELYSLSTTTNGSPVLISSGTYPPGVGDIYAATYDNVNNRLYAVGIAGSTQALYRVNTSNGAFTQIGTNLGVTSNGGSCEANGQGMNGLAFDPFDNRLIGCSANRLYYINTSTGVASQGPSLPYTNFRGLAFDRTTNRLYGVRESGQIYQINKYSGSNLGLVTSTGFPYSTALTFLPAADCEAPQCLSTVWDTSIYAPSGCPMTAYPSIQSNPQPWAPSDCCDKTAVINFYDRCKGRCEVTFSIPESTKLCLNDIDSVLDIRPVLGEGCGDVYDFEILVKKTSRACQGGVYSFPYREGFEQGWGLWTQETNDDFDWTRRMGSTPSSATGPSSAAEGNYYVYTESSWPNYPNKQSCIVSPCLDFSQLSNPAISFQYHMYGSTMGTLQLQVSTNGGISWGTIWAQGGDQGNQWRSETRSLASFAGNPNVKIRFCGTTSTSYRSDMAIDDIEIYNNILPVKGSTPLAKAAASAPSTNYYWIAGSSTCLPILECDSIDTGDCAGVGDPVNPYIKGLKGVWHPLRTLLYLSDRTVTANNVRYDGEYAQFAPFWRPNGSSPWIYDETGWTWAERVTKYSPFGYDVETEDALFRRNAAQYSYNNQLPIAISANAGLQDIANENFEAANSTAACQVPHVQFDNTGGPLIFSESVAHSGLFSVESSGGDTIFACHALNVREPDCSKPFQQPNGKPYDVQTCDCIGGFKPTPGDSFVTSVWMRLDPAVCGPNPIFDYVDLDLHVEVDGLPVTLFDTHRSPIIEGWQRVEYAFVIPPSASDKIVIRFTNSSNDRAFFDDFRIHPFFSGLKTYVYHPYSLRLMAEGDAQNHMTFYEYDEEGNLIRVKRETEKGILTVQENRNSLFKN